MTLSECYKQSLLKLKNPDVDEINVRILLCSINGLNSMTDFYLRKDDNLVDEKAFDLMFDRYLKGEPIQYILRESEFYGLKFYVDENVLIPRQETEEVVDYVIKKINEKKLVFIDVLDVCCGSGVMGLTIASKVNVKNLTLSDISPGAIEVAKINAKKHKISANFMLGDTIAPFLLTKVKVNLLISNPPYILQEKEIDDSAYQFEPHIALLADEDLSVYKKILSNLPKVLTVDGFAVFEIGYDIKEKLENFLKTLTYNFSYEFLKDMNGKFRILAINMLKE